MRPQKAHGNASETPARRPYPGEHSNCFRLAVENLLVGGVLQSIRMPSTRAEQDSTTSLSCGLTNSYVPFWGAEVQQSSRAKIARGATHGNRFSRTGMVTEGRL